MTVALLTAAGSGIGAATARELRAQGPGFIDSIPQPPERTAGAALARMGRAEEVARTIAFLCSDGAGYITGQNIRVDGGLARSA